MTMPELSKIYDPKSVEGQIYQQWEGSGFFNPDNLKDAEEPFTVAMPPANVTAELHLGSAMFLTIEDLMTRHARMSGKKTLWLPGTDHAAIATQNVVERKLWQEENKTRHDIGREALLQKIEEFVAKTKGRIQLQMRKMGSSCDWSREKYTLSPELSRVVRIVFKKMYDAGLVYRGERIVNWCPRCSTTLADDEVEYKKTAGTLYFIRYAMAKGPGELVIATTRPETMLADTAVAVHPADPRYQKLVGQSVMLPLLNRELKIIADEYVDRDFATGALKITPGHDPNDFEISKRHNLAIINLFTTDGKISSTEAADHGFEEYSGLIAAEARKKIIIELGEAGFLEKTENIEHNVGHCYRCDAMVEPIISKQWFVNVNGEWKIENIKFQKKIKIKEKTTLKEMAIAAVKSGAIKIVPERFTKTYLNWMENLRDWNISRQIWFGHQVPVWHCEACEEDIVAVETPVECPKCKSDLLVQDPDTLDTWFSSSLWTFSTLGWPEQTDDLKNFHPTTVMETGYDILFFWVARMVLMTGFVVEDIPFQTVYLHGMVRDFEGKKMSKSRGNAINPLQMIEKYGTDALRLSLVLGSTPGNDTKIYEQKIENYRNFVNKFWNISRFILSSAPSFPGTRLPDGQERRMPEGQQRSLADEWILSELDNLIIVVNKHFAAYQYGQAGEALYDFTWNKFADWYIESAKCKMQNAKLENTNAILNHVLQTLLKLWHPFIPFVTEHIWSQFSKEPLMIQKYPEAKSEKRKAKNTEQFGFLQNLITGLRNLRSEYRQPPGEIFAAYIETAPEWLQEHLPIVEKLARVRVNFDQVPEDKKMPYFLWSAAGGRVYLIIPRFDPKKETALAKKDLSNAESLADRLKAQLSKKEFLKKAPPEIVEKLKTDAEAAEKRIKKLKEKINLLK